MYHTLILTVFLVLPTLVFAHPGRTDASGCHTNKATGEYHCHGAKTAKQTTKKVARMAAPTSDRNCSDFSTQKAAQAFFLQAGGSTHDSHRLDADKDGKACENLK